MPHSFHLPRFSSRARSVIILGADAALAAVSLLTAYLLRFEGSLPASEQQNLPRVLLLLLAGRLLANFFFRLDRWSYRFSGLTDGARVATAGLFGTGLWALGLYLTHTQGLSRAIVVMELLMSTAAMAAVRFVPRLWWMYRADILRARQPGVARTVIVGAGAAGENLLRDLRRSADHGYLVLGFVDDNPSLWGRVVGGRSVLGAISDLPNLASRYGVELVLLAIPRLPAGRVREILTLCSSLKLRFKILPMSFHRLHEAATNRMLQDLTPQDLLEREEVEFSHDDAPPFSAERLQLVAGAAGSIGSEVCSQLLAAGCQRLVMLDVAENRLYMLKRHLERLYPDRMLSTELADIRDLGRVRSLFARYRPHDVFHAAACKHVPLMETAPGEAVKTNVVGTHHLISAAHEFGAARFVFMSTDKAVRPTSVMGATKRLGELLIDDINDRSETRFSAVRFGNVLDSEGSVVPIFRQQIRAGGPVTVTHPEMRRYFMTISEAVGLVLRTAYGDYGQLCVLEMGEPIKIVDLARHMITMSGLVPDVDVKIVFTGLRPGEKLDEELLGDGERVLRRVERRVRVVEGPPPSGKVLKLVDSLALAAAREDATAVRRCLAEAVRDYRTPEVSLDSGSLDSGSLDSGSLDSGSLDSGSLDSGSLGSGSFDGGSLDGGSLDGGASFVSPFLIRREDEIPPS